MHRFRQPWADRTCWFFDDQRTILADHDDTAGRYDLIWGSRLSARRRRRTRYTEHFDVLEGGITVWLEGRTAVRGIGESLIDPLGAAHAIGSTGDW